jgi:hypothetical protein
MESSAPWGKERWRRAATNIRTSTLGGPRALLFTLFFFFFLLRKCRWIPHNAGFGFLGIAGPALGVSASLGRFEDLEKEFARQS